jgi:hypothetical protein
VTLLAEFRLKNGKLAVNPLLLIEELFRVVAIRQHPLDSPTDTADSVAVIAGLVIAE